MTAIPVRAASALATLGMRASRTPRANGARPMSPQDPTLDRLGAPQPLPRPGGGQRRRVAWLAVGAVGTAAAVAGGLWAWQAWTEQGAQPAEALPADTLAYVALDFDPPGRQKAAALGSLRKFPTASRELGLDSADALFRSLVEEVASEEGCELDHAKDVAPWVGHRVAFAVVPQSRPEPVVVLQVQDAAGAEAGLASVTSGCADDLSLGHAVAGDWAVLARTDAVAARVLADAGKQPLAEESDFRTLVAAAGDPGVATVFAAPEAGPTLLAEMEEHPYLGYGVVPLAQTGIDPMGGLFLAVGVGGLAGPETGEGWAEGEEEFLDPMPLTPEQEALQKDFERFDELTPQERRDLVRRSEELWGAPEGPDHEAGEESGYAELDPLEPGEDELLECTGEGEEEECFLPMQPHLPDELRAALADFSGLGGVARVEGGALEVEVVTDRLEGTTRDVYRGGNALASLAALPAGSAVALGAGLTDGWVQTFIDSVVQQASMFGGPEEFDAVANLERATGLDLPQDLDALGGRGFSLVVAEGFDPDTAFDDPARARVAAHVLGDQAGIEAALAKLRTKIDAELLQSRRVDGGVVVGPNAGYLDELARAGAGLGASDRFAEAVPDAEGADSLMYVDFDAGDWLVRSLDEDERGDAAPLEALGMSVTPEGERDRIRLRLSLD